MLQLFDDTFRYNTALSWTRSVFSVLMLVGLVAVWWLFRPRPGTAYEPRAVAGTTAAYAVAFAANAVTLPWYYASLISLTGTFRPPAWVVKGMIVLPFRFFLSKKVNIIIGYWPHQIGDPM